MLESNMKINTILNSSDRVQIVAKLLDKISKDSYTDGCQFINQLSTISNNRIHNLQCIAQSYAEAANWAIIQQSFNSNDKYSLFYSIVPVCKAYFPSGNTKGCGQAQKNILVNLFNYLKIPKYLILKNSEWANTHHYPEYFQLVLSQN